MKVLALISALWLAGAQAHTTMECPARDHGQRVGERITGVNKRGDHAMGFSQETTVHHFTLLPDGGLIKVDIMADHDDATRDQIRMHLTHIATMFTSNNFDTPMFIHDRVPPGVPIMREKHATITYTFQPAERGGQVRVVTHDPKALEAVHAFLRFQIQDHRTGDSQEIKAQP
jgi:hypothetical protein